jgi:N-acetylmuramic acid 6-phosphate etherase
MDPLKRPITERNNIRSEKIAQFDTFRIVETIHLEDIKAYEAVGCQLEKISNVIDKIYENFKRGGRIIYIGAGTSGRIGAQDAIEMWPTYGLGKDRFDYLIAGGEEALRRSVENAEDMENDAVNGLRDKNLNSLDTVVGISASGTTPFVIAGVRYAKMIGAYTVAIVNNPESPMLDIADDSIVLNTGEEVIQGSTRLKAGTAQKMVLNIISTSIAVKSGRTYGNQMIHMKAFYNRKLRQRAVNILMERYGLNEEKARELLEKNNYNILIAMNEIERLIKAGKNDVMK